MLAFYDVFGKIYIFVFIAKKFNSNQKLFFVVIHLLFEKISSPKPSVSQPKKSKSISKFKQSHIKYYAPIQHIHARKTSTVIIRTSTTWNMWEDHIFLFFNKTIILLILFKLILNLNFSVKVSCKSAHEDEPTEKPKLLQSSNKKKKKLWARKWKKDENF